MHYLKRISRKNGEDGVSPVVGVMLMLVVMIIIAAVVSGFAGSLVSGKKTSPSMSMDVTIKNAGSFSNSYFEAKVLSISEPVNTSELKIVTTWAKAGTTHVTNTLPGHNVTYWEFTGDAGKKIGNITGAPWGYGPGVDNMNAGVPNKEEQRFGNYTLIGGTMIYALPAGQAGGFIDPTSPSENGGYGINTPYKYTDSWVYTPGVEADGMQTILGEGWEVLRAGDFVNVKLIYTPTGSAIFEKNVVVS
ncbi:MAG TPA: type IV pilin N-terminal domain-containing protein [Methanoregula sp.]|mgnify:CR=1 FL=1|nr:type IV pilin N-terminal domain-containing protein [Methanoregula sp.]